MVESPAISVVIPCRNEVSTIGSCLHSILEQAPPPGGFEVIVADGMSDDGTREVLEGLAASDSRLRVVDNPLRSTPCAMNRAIRVSRGRWIAIMGAHNRYAGDYLVRCLEVALATGADNVGGAMVSQGNSLIEQAIAAAHHSSFGTGGAPWHDPEYEGPCDTVFGGFYQRRVFERIGLFDEELVRNQDDEFNLRLNRAGGTVWHSPNTRSYYQPRKSLLALFRRCQGDGYWKVRVIQKHKLPASWRHLVPGAFVLALTSLGLMGGALCALPDAVGAWSGQTGRLALLTFFGLAGLYALAALGAAALAARKHGWSVYPLLPAVFACYHFGYGYGFLHGLWDFVIRQKYPEPQGRNLLGAVSP